MKLHISFSKPFGITRVRKGQYLFENFTDGSFDLVKTKTPYETQWVVSKYPKWVHWGIHYELYWAEDKSKSFWVNIGFIHIYFLRK